MDHKSLTPSASLVEISISPSVSACALSLTNTVWAIDNTFGLLDRKAEETSCPVVRFDAIPTYDHPVQEPED